jgi:predicted Zn-dependent protease
MPIFALVGASLARLGKRAAFPLSRAVFVAPIAASYALLTLQETRSYRDLETLFLDTVAKNPDAWMAQYNLGVVAAERGDLTTAIARYREALRTQPDDVFIVTNLGDLLVETGHADEGLALLRRGVALDPVNPIALQALANRLRSTGHAREAAETYRAVLRVQPGAQRPTLSLAALIASARDPSVGSPTEAVALLEPFCPKLKKLRAECLDDLSLAYQSAGRREDALRAAEEALASPTISEARAKRIRERIESDRKAP